MQYASMVKEMSLQIKTVILNDYNLSCDKKFNKIHINSKHINIYEDFIFVYHIALP